VVNKDLILDGVWFGLENRPFALHDLAMSVLIYDYFGEQIPEANKVIAPLISMLIAASVGGGKGYLVDQKMV